MKNKYAVIVVDMLNDFVHGKLKCKNALEIIGPLKTLIDAAHKHQVPVIYANDYHFKNDHELLLWNEHAMANTKGAQVISQLKILSQDFVVNKHVYSAFFNTNLHELLKKIKVNTLIITGLHTHMCCRHTAADGYQHGYKIVIPIETTTSFTKQDYELGIKYLKDVYGAKIDTIKNVIKTF